MKPAWSWKPSQEPASPFGHSPVMAPLIGAGFRYAFALASSATVTAAERSAAAAVWSILAATPPRHLPAHDPSYGHGSPNGNEASDRAAVECASSFGEALDLAASRAAAGAADPIFHAHRTGTWILHPLRRLLADIEASTGAAEPVAEPALWRLVQEALAPPDLLGGGAWPMEPDTSDAATMRFAIWPERIPDPAAAASWLTAFRAQLRTGAMRAAYLRHEAAPLRNSAAAAAAAAWRFAAELSSDEGAAVRVEVAQAALQDDPLAADARALPALALELQAQIGRMREALGMLGAPPADDAAALEQEGGILAQDERFAAFVATMGAAGMACAVEVRERAAKRGEGPADGLRWGMWTTLQGFALRLATVLWTDLVAPRLARRPRVDALVYPIAVEVTNLHSRAHTLEREGSQAVLRYQWGAVRPIDTLDARIIDIVARGERLLGNVLGHQVLRWEVATGNRQMQLQDLDPGAYRDPRKIEAARGWRGIAEALGLTHKGAPDQIRAIVHAQAHCCFALPSGGFGNLLQKEEHPGKGPHPGRVVIVLGDPLMPGYAPAMGRDLGTTATELRARKLVPLLPLPPFVGKPHDHGAQATFAMRLVCEMRLQARDLVEKGGALFSLADLVDMGERAGMPRTITVTAGQDERRTLPGVLASLDRWTREGDAAAMFQLVEGRVGGEVRIHLGEAYAAERDFMNQAGEVEIKAARAGKASHAARTAAKEGRTVTKPGKNRRTKGA